jgi:hypothetical protein
MQAEEKMWTSRRLFTLKKKQSSEVVEDISDVIVEEEFGLTKFGARDLGIGELRLR